MKRVIRIAIWSVAGLVVAAVVVLGGIYVLMAKDLSGYWPWETRTAVEYRIPEGYQGWVQVRWAVPGAPTLTKSGGYFIVAFDSEGQAFTSSAPEGGWATDRYFYVSDRSASQLRVTGWCKGGIIWGGEFSQGGQNDKGDSPTTTVEKFFVGTENSYRNIVDPQNNIYHPCPKISSR